MARFESLALAVRIPVVARYFGLLLMGVGVMIAVAGCYAFFVQDFTFARRSGLMFLLVIGGGLICCQKPAPSDLQVNESLIIISLTFLTGAAAMVWPLMSDGTHLSDAVFEAVSALTTTGLTTITNVEQRPASFLFARAWMQWYGGLVIVVLALGLVIEPGPAAKRLFGTEAEATGLVAGTRQRARRALAVYLALLAVGAIVLFSLGLNPFDAIVHSFAAVSTGGFSTRSDSIEGLGGFDVQVAVIGLALCGAISLSSLPKSPRRGWTDMVRDEEVRALIVISCIASLALILTLVLLEGRSWSDSLRIGPLLAFSAQTTSGFQSTSVEELGGVSKATLILSMFVGGDAGSTAGGIKIVRFLVVLRLIQLVIRRTCLPRHAVLELEKAGSPISAESVFAMVAIVILFLVVIVISWIAFLIFGYSPLDSLFEVVSAVGTVGLTSGISNTGLPVLLKVVLCLDMLMGRLEIVAIILLFYPRTWFGRKADIG